MNKNEIEIFKIIQEQIKGIYESLDSMLKLMKKQAETMNKIADVIIQRGN